MSKRISLLATALLIISSAVFVAAQTTTTTVTQTPTKVTKTVQNPDGTYTVIEYPVGKEVQLTFTPVSLTKSKAVGTILRDDTGTKVILNLTDVPAEVSAINVYAVDDAGVVTSLGPVILANGAGKFTATTPLSKFMLIAAPEGTLTAYDPNTKVFFRSAVPEGFAVIPLSTSPVGETVAATAAPVAVTATPVVVTATPVAETAAPVVVTATPVAVTAAPVVVTAAPVVVTAAPVAVTAAPVVVTAAPVADAATVVPVPMLNIPAYKKGDDTKLKVDFTGAMSGARANIFIEPNKNGKETEVKMVFHDLKEAPTGQIYILWAVSPDNQFSKLGQIVNLKGRNEAEIKANTTLADFGLLVTMEDLAAAKTVVIPVGPRLGVIQLIP
jgi:hypothetical protein